MMISKFHRIQNVLPALRGVLFMTVLMFAFTVTAAYASPILFKFKSDAAYLIAYLVLSMSGIAIAGSIGMRLAHLEWKSVIIAALLFMIGLFTLLSFAYTNIMFGGHLDNLFFAWPGVFLLPLFDPVIRKSGLTPSRWKVVLVALALTAITILVDALISEADFGFITFWIGTILSLVLMALGAILAVGDRTVLGAWLGGLGLILFACILVAGRLLGGGFPMIAD